MGASNNTLKLPTIGLILLAASQIRGVRGATLHQYVSSCGYGYQQCHEGYECVRSDEYQNGAYISSCRAIGYSTIISINPSSTPYNGHHYSSYAFSSSDSAYTYKSEYGQNSDNPPNYGSSTQSGYSTPTWYTSEPEYSQTPSEPQYKSTPVPTQKSSYGNSVYSPGYSSYSSQQSGYNYEDSNYPADPTKTPVGPQRPGYSPYNPRSGTSKFTAVVGAQPKVIERRSIDVLQRDHKDVFNMLILALESLQKRAETEDLSYYQLSGIHGYPFIPWQYPHQNPDPQTGYCTHKSAIFTTWHRPYVILLEQILQKEAVSIAKHYVGKNALRYRTAAEEVRMPYWDWASDDTDSRLPSVVLEKSIAVVKPGSQGSVTIPNPFYNYHRKDINMDTARSPSANSDLVSTFDQRKLSTNDLFSDSSYNEFSKNLENIHDLVHVDVGGDMADITTAAFDPIFWMHHCNVDRLMAMYQASHPNTYLAPEPRSPTFALHLPGTDDLSTPLYPFRHPNAREWTSDDVKTAASIFKYGYSYPEVPPGLSDEALRKFTSEKANKLYGPKVQGASFDGVKSGAPEATARREWTANVVCDSEEIPGSQKIQIYIGDYDSNRNGSYSYPTNDLAGVAAIFSGTSPNKSPNRYLNISVPLTQALVDKNVGLRPEDVIPKLVDQLHWVIQKVGTSNGTSNGAIIPVTDLKSLKISISSNIADYPEDKTTLPIKSGSQIYYAPTTHKAGGLQPGQAPPVKGPAYNGTVSR